MKIVNRLSVPETIFRLLETDFYDHDQAKGTLSATTLNKPAQMVVLTERHWDQIEIEAMDRLWVVLGMGVHAALQSSDTTSPGVVVPDRLRVDFAGAAISGLPDFLDVLRIDNNSVVDYKVTKAFSLVYMSHLQDWIKQLSIYRWLWWKVKDAVLSEIGRIVAILRDWDEREVAKKPKYPNQPMLELMIPLWSPAKTEAYILDRVKAIEEARTKTDAELPKCTDEERWWNWTQKKYLRCEKYCQVRAFCRQHNSGGVAE